MTPELFALLAIGVILIVEILHARMVIRDNADTRREVANVRASLEAFEQWRASASLQQQDAYREQLAQTPMYAPQGDQDAYRQQLEKLQGAANLQGAADPGRAYPMSAHKAIAEQIARERANYSKESAATRSRNLLGRGDDYGC